MLLRRLLRANAFQIRAEFYCFFLRFFQSHCREISFFERLAWFEIFLRGDPNRGAQLCPRQRQVILGANEFLLADRESYLGAQ